MQHDKRPKGRTDLTELYRTAARHDCGYLLDFHCHNLFGERRVAQLTAGQTAEWVAAAREDIGSRTLLPAPQDKAPPPRGFASADAFIEPVPIAHVDNGLAGDLAQFLFRLWRRNKGIILADRDLTRISSQLLLTLPDATPGDVPHVTFIGNQSSFVKFFPQALDAEAYASPAECLPRDYRSGIAEGYRWALNGEPSFDIQRTGFILGEGVPDMTLQRLLLRFETRSGFARIFSLVTLLEMHARPFDPNRSDARRWRQDGLSWHPAYQVSSRKRRLPAT